MKLIWNRNLRKKAFMSGFAVILSTTFLHAQSKIDPGNPLLSPHYSVEKAHEFPIDKNPLPEEKTPGQILLSANFSNSLGSWTTSGTNGTIWQHDDNGPSGQFSVAANEIIASQSVNNGFAIFDADLSNPGPGPWQARSGALVSPAFSMTGVTYAFVEFYQKYRFCCDAAFFPKLEVSNNDFVTYASFDASIPNVGSGIISPTELSKVNISAFLDTATDLSAVRIRFNFQGSSQATHYYWQIDDVKVIESHEYDLRMTSYNMGMGQMQLPYYFMPLSQISPVTFYASGSNDGSMMAGKAHLEVNLSQGGGSATSDSIDLQPAESANFVSFPLTPPGSWGYYTVNYQMVQDSIDGYSSDDALTSELYIFDRQFSIDNNEGSAYISNVSSQPGQPFKIGNVMEVLQDDITDSMEVIITGTQSNIDQQIYGELRKKVNGVWQYVESTQPVWITWDNYTMPIGLRFWNPVSVSAGDTLLVLVCHNGGSPDVRFKTAQSVPVGIVQGYTSNGTLFSLSDPHAIMTRLYMNAIVGVADEQIDGLKISPNPFSNELNIDNLDSEGILSIYDLNGREVFSQKVGYGVQVSVNTFSWAPGIYTVNYLTNGKNLNRKVVKF